MILPDKLDQLVVECMKELHNTVDDSNKKDVSNVFLLYEVPELYSSYITEDKCTPIISKYIDNNPLSLNQRRIFMNLIKSFIK